MNYPDSVEYLYALGNEYKAVKLDLKPAEILLRALGDPHFAFASVHVAGTNGKGSTCAMIESGLRSAGVRTGLFTSPHLIQPTERIKIAGADVNRGQFTQAFDEVHAAAEKLLKRGELAVHPSYFDTVTAMAFLIFQQQRVEIAVIEVGLGGRLDSTNVVLPILSVITPVDFDHELFLGNSLDKIAWEKAGILKPGVPAVFSSQRPEAAEVIERVAGDRRCLVTRTADFPPTDLNATRFGATFEIADMSLECPLAGMHQVENARTAFAALRQLGISNDAIQQGIRETVWPGRLERFSGNPTLILDGAHNPAGARQLANYIRTFYREEPVWLIFAAMRDKPVQELTELLFPLAQHVRITAPDSPRAVRPESLCSVTEHPDIKVEPNIRTAIEHCRQEANPSDVIFVTGSLYIVGEARAILVE